MIRRVALLAVLLLALSLPTWGAAESKSGSGARGQAAAVTDGPAARLDREAPAEGGSVPEYRLAEGGQDRSLLWDGARMVLSLAAVLLLLGLGVKALRRWPVLTGRSVAAGPLEVLGRLSLGAKEAVCLVRAGNVVLALGISAAGVNLLCRLDGAAVGAQPSTAGSRSAAGAGAGLLPSGRLRELAARLRDVQTAWGLPRADAEDRR